MPIIWIRIGRPLIAMIAFDLECTNGHTFEGWFADSRAYEDQKSLSLIACPYCETTDVAKKLSSFAIKSSPRRSVADLVEKKAQIEALGKEISHFVENNFDDVGCNFAREALKIHYGAVEPRNIRGVSTEAEEKTLQEEGVKFFKFPVAKPSDPDA
jgi:hypothetical protein